MSAAEAGLVAADVLAAQWWLERWLVVVCQLVKTAAVFRTVGSLSLTVNSPKSSRVLICCIDFLYLWQRRLTVG